MTHPTPAQVRAARAAELLAPHNTISETVRANHKDAMLREARRAFAQTPSGTGSRDGIEVEVHTVNVTHDLFPHGLRMADLEAIDARRAFEVAEKVADVIVERCYDS